MPLYEYGVEFTQYDEYEHREISERTTVYFKYIPQETQIREKLLDEGYKVLQILDYNLFRTISDM